MQGKMIYLRISDKQLIQRNKTEKAFKQKCCAENYFENCKEGTHVTYVCLNLEKEGNNSSNNDKITNIGAPL